TAAVFLPIITWEGEVGELLRDIAYAVAIAVSLSLVVAVLAIPSLAAKILGTREKARPASGLFGKVNEWGARSQEKLVALVRFVLASASRSLLVVLAGVGAPSALAIAMLPDMEYLPTGNRNLIFGVVLPVPGIGVTEL